MATVLWRRLGLTSKNDFEEWLQGRLVKPYWDLFYTKFLRHVDLQAPFRHPSLAVLVDQVKSGTTGGQVKYSIDTEIDTSAWLKEDWYANFMYRCTRLNRSDQEGVYHQRQITEIDSYKETYEVLKLLIQRARKRASSANGATEVDDDSLEVAESTDGLIRVIWKNAAHPIHGSPSSHLRQCLVQKPDQLTAVGLLDILRGKFHLAEHGLNIGKLYELRKDGARLRQVMLDQTRWQVFRAVVSTGEGSVMLLWLESCIASIQRSSGLEYTRLDLDYATKNYHPSDPLREELEVTDLNYALMVQEKQSASTTAICRLDQFEALLKVATLTTGLPDGDIVRTFEGSDTLDIAQSNRSSLQWANELALSYHEIVHGRSKAMAQKGTEQFDSMNQEEVRKFDRHEALLDNCAYQRDNLSQAIQALNIRDSARLTIAGMGPGLILKPHQVLGIQALREFEESFFHAGLLADNVGLGKTLTVLGLLQFRWNQRKSALNPTARKVRFGAPKPTMICVPPSLVAQWVCEILQHLSDFTVVIYYAAYSDKSVHPRKVHLKEKLTREHPIFQDSETSESTIVVTSFRTFARRHGPQRQIINRTRREEQEENEEEGDGEDDEENDEEVRGWNLEPDRGQPGYLGGCFKRLVVDEAHFLKGGPRAASWIAIHWLQAQYKIAVTATPTHNRISDLSALLRLLQPGELGLPQYLVGWGLDPDIEKCNPWEMATDDPELSYLKCHYRVFELYVVNEEDQAIQGKRLSDIFGLILLKRGYGSRIPFGTGPRLGDTVPPMQQRTIELAFTQDEHQRYRLQHNKAVSDLINASQGPEGVKIRFNSTAIRALSHYTTWLPFDALLKTSGAELPRSRHARLTLRTLYNIVIQEEPLLGEVGPSPLDLLEWFGRHSPKLRWLGWLVANLCVKNGEKLVIWWLKAAGLEAESYHSGLGEEARVELIRKFHCEEVHGHILICSYAINSCGLNLHGLCRNTVLVEPAASLDVEIQAIGRIRRLGQTQEQRVFRLYLQKSWNEWQQANQRQKALGPLSSLLNGDLVELGEGESARYVMKGDIPDHLRHLQGMEKKMFLEELYRLLMDEGSIRSKTWNLKQL
ncbi:MAG: hypothetical protein M1826_006574 [Phylliscum demangeonii]|nr:MAG: hypothetical protein M1826_006574 [Phylliscum demangeonii]